MRGTVSCNFNEKQKRKPKKLLTALPIASGLPQTKRIKLATCKLGCLFQFPVDVASRAPRGCTKQSCLLWKCSVQASQSGAAGHCVGVRRWVPQAQNAMSPEENRFCAGGTGTEREIGWLSEGQGDPPLSKLCPVELPASPSSQTASPGRPTKTGLCRAPPLHWCGAHGSGRKNLGDAVSGPEPWLLVVP